MFCRNELLDKGSKTVEFLAEFRENNTEYETKLIARDKKQKVKTGQGRMEKLSAKLHKKTTSRAMQGCRVIVLTCRLH